MASFELPKIQENPDGGWGPSASSVPVEYKLKDIPFAPFSKSDKLSRFADWNGVAGDDNKGGQGAAHGGRAGAGNRRREGAPAFGSGLPNAFADLRMDDEASFSVVDNRTTAPRRAGPGFNRGRGGSRGSAFVGRGGQRGGGRGGNNFGAGRGGQRGGGGGGWGNRGRYRDWDKGGRIREASVTVSPEWDLVEEIEFSRLSRLRLDVEEPENLESYGMLYSYDKTYDRLTTRTSKPLEILDRVKYNPTTSDDPVILKLAEKDAATVYVTDSILSFLMCAPRSVYPWDIVVVRKGNKVFFDKREEGPLDTVTVNENAQDPPQDTITNANPNNPAEKNAQPDVSPINTASSLAEEAAHINTSFGFQAVVEKTPPPAVNFANPNPFLWPEESRPLASCAYRYRLFDLSVLEEENIKMCVRTEVDAYMPGATPASVKTGQGLVKIRALNEFDSKAYGAGGAPDWRTKLDTQRGAVVATEMKNNSCKLTRWAVQSILAGAEVLKIGYVSRSNPKDERRHVILSTASMRPLDFAGQLNMSIPNGWGIIRAITDVCMKQPEGKYVLVMVKEPNRGVLRLYSVPMNTFTNEEEEEVDASDAEEGDSAN